MSMTDTQSNPYIEKSRANAQTTIGQIQSIARSNQRHADVATMTETVQAQATFATAFIYGTLEITAVYQGYNIRFYGTMWGLGFGGGTTWGALTLTLPATQLNNLECSFQVTTAASSVTIQIWNDPNGYVANFTGAGLSIGAGITGGNGKWTISPA